MTPLTGSVTVDLETARLVRDLAAGGWEQRRDDVDLAETERACRAVKALDVAIAVAVYAAVKAKE